ncbi:MAG: RNA methyltransferase [Acidobacteria bacterium]|nr:RNA methyltransferase [Acidobacteriota bacterium]
MKTISSRQNPIVRAFRALADAPDADGTRLLLDGVHLVREARAAALGFEAVAVASSRLNGNTEEGEMARSLDSAGAPVFAVGDEAFATMIPVRSPSGIAAIAWRSPSDPTAICRAANGFTLVAVDVQDPGNLGALVRAAEAGGVTGVLVTGTSANPFSWKALRGSMGSALRLPVAAGLTPDAIVACARTSGTTTVAAVPHDGRAPDTINWSRPVALLLGGEGPGLPAGVLAQCDELVTIPMTPPVESLNVAVAGAILIYAARRQQS